MGTPEVKITASLNLAVDTIRGLGVDRVGGTPANVCTTASHLGELSGWGATYAR